VAVPPFFSLLDVTDSTHFTFFAPRVLKMCEFVLWITSASAAGLRHRLPITPVIFLMIGARKYRAGSRTGLSR
jgi:hypothetical protein